MFLDAAAPLRKQDQMPPSAPTLVGALNAQEEAVGRLAESVAKLRDVLNPLFTPAEEPYGVAALCISCGPAAPAVSHALALADRTRAAACAVEDILRRLAL